MDLNTVNTDLVSREFLAVVLAGFGNEYVRRASAYSLFLYVQDSCP